MDDEEILAEDNRDWAEARQLQGDLERSGVARFPGAWCAECESDTHNYPFCPSDPADTL